MMIVYTTCSSYTETKVRSLHGLYLILYKSSKPSRHTIIIGTV